MTHMEDIKRLELRRAEERVKFRCELAALALIALPILGILYMLWRHR